MLTASLLPLNDSTVRIRPMTHGDAEAYADGTTDEDVRRYAHLPLPEYTPATVVEMVDGVVGEGLATGELAVLTIADTPTDRFAGSLVLFDVRDDVAEVGFWLLREARGEGFASAALALAVDLAGRSGLHRLIARTVVDNVPSQDVLVGAGFVPVRRGHGAAPSGQEVELIHYERVLSAHLTATDRPACQPGKDD